MSIHAEFTMLSQAERLAKKIAEVEARVGYTQEQKEAMKKLVLAGMEAEDEAMAYCMATYGLEASDANGLLASVSILYKVFGEQLMEGLDAQKEWDNNAKSRRAQAIYDFARIVIKGYYRSKPEYDRIVGKK